MWRYLFLVHLAFFCLASTMGAKEVKDNRPEIAVTCNAEEMVGSRLCRALEEDIAKSSLMKLGRDERAGYVLGVVAVDEGQRGTSATISLVYRYGDSDVQLSASVLTCPTSGVDDCASGAVADVWQLLKVDPGPEEIGKIYRTYRSAARLSAWFDRDIAKAFEVGMSLDSILLNLSGIAVSYPGTSFYLSSCECLFDECRTGDSFYCMPSNRVIRFDEGALTVENISQLIPVELTRLGGFLKVEAMDCDYRDSIVLAYDSNQKVTKIF